MNKSRQAPRHILANTGPPIHPSAKSLEEVLLARAASGSRLKLTTPPTSSERRTSSRPGSSSPVARLPPTVLPAVAPLKAGPLSVAGSPSPAQYAFFPERVRAATSPGTTAAGGARHGSVDYGALQDQCQVLVSRVQNLERMIATPGSPGRLLTSRGGEATSSQAQLTVAAGAPHTGPWRSRGTTSKAKAAAAAAQQTEIAAVTNTANQQLGSVHKTLLDMTGLMARLDSVYINRGELAERHYLAASKIQATARGFVARRRFAAAEAGLQRWRMRHGAPLIKACRLFLDKVEQVRQWTAMTLVSRDLRLKSDVLRVWSVYVKERSPAAKERADNARLMLQQKQQRLLRKIMVTWRDTAHGPHSRKAMMAKYKERYAAAKDRVAQKLEIAAAERGTPMQRVSKEMIVNEMATDAVRVMDARMRLLTMRMPFNGWRNVYLLPLHEKSHRAFMHWSTKVKTEIMRRWKIHTEEHMGDVKAHARPKERFDSKVNINTVKLHYRHTMLRKHIKAWWTYATRCAEAKRKYQNVTDALCVRVLRAWNVQAQYQKQLKRQSLDQWREHSRRLLQVPFRAWFIWAHNQRQTRQAQEILLQAYARRKKRMLMYNYYKLWAHRAIYGKVESMHSRAELVQRLEDQKRYTHTLEVANAELTATLHRTEQALAGEAERVAAKSEELVKKDEEVAKLRFAVDHAETEIIRLQALVDSIARVHPLTVKRLQQEAGDEGISDRGFSTYTRALASSKAAPLLRSSSHRGGGVDDWVDDFLLGLDPRSLPPLALEQTTGTKPPTQGRKRAWSVDLGTVSKVTAATSGVIGEQTEEPSADDPEQQLRAAQNLQSTRVAMATGHGGRRGSLSGVPLSALDQSVDADVPSDVPELGRMVWVSEADAMVLRRLKQVQVLLENTNSAREKLHRALEQAARRHHQRKAEQERVKRMTDAMDTSVSKIKEKKRGPGTPGARTPKPAGVEEETPEQAAVNIVKEAALAASANATSDAELSAVTALVDLFLDNRLPSDEAEGRRVELKRWASVWAYVMDGRRLFVRPRHRAAAEAQRQKSVRAITSALRESKAAEETALRAAVTSPTAAGLPSPGGRRTPAMTTAVTEPAEADEDPLSPAGAAPVIEEEADQAGAAVVADPTLAETPAWSAFVEGISFEYPTHHPAFVTSEELIQRRVAERRLARTEAASQRRLNLFKDATSSL